jgi:predicted glycosyltransferase
MRIIFYLHHPAQFHLFKGVISHLQQKHEILIVATKKDVLINLLEEHNFEFINILPEGRKNNLFSIGLGLIKQDWRFYKICKSYKPNLLIGTSTEITHIGRLLNIKSLFFLEDDLKVVPLLNYLAFPFAHKIVAPKVCDLGKWKKKVIPYEGYQKLAYLHPNQFNIKPQKNHDKIALIRLSSLGAYHDIGIKGISHDLLDQIIKLLHEKDYKIYISSENELDKKYEAFKLKIKPSAMHEFMTKTSLLICDSQSMTVEAAILGIPNIRYSSFAGKISVLEELEKKYELTYGIKSGDEEKLMNTLSEIINDKEIKEKFIARKTTMLNEKIDVTSFLIWFIENYPESEKIMKDNPDYQLNFK